MQRARHATKPSLRIDGNTLRRHQALPWAEWPRELMRLESQHSAGEALRPFLNLDFERTGVNQGKSPCLALRFGGGWMCKCQKRVTKMRREPGGTSESSSRCQNQIRFLSKAFDHLPLGAILNLAALTVSLSSPVTVEANHLEIFIW